MRLRTERRGGQLQVVGLMIVPGTVSRSNYQLQVCNTDACWLPASCSSVCCRRIVLIQWNVWSWASSQCGSDVVTEKNYLHGSPPWLAGPDSRDWSQQPLLVGFPSQRMKVSQWMVAGNVGLDEDLAGEYNLLIRFISSAQQNIMGSCRSQQKKTTAWGIFGLMWWLHYVLFQHNSRSLWGLMISSQLLPSD